MRSGLLPLLVALLPVTSLAATPLASADPAGPVPRAERDGDTEAGPDGPDGRLVLLPAGTRVLLLANPEAPAISIPSLAVSAEILERRGPWLRIRFDSTTGWVRSAALVPSPAGPGEDLAAADSTDPAGTGQAGSADPAGGAEPAGGGAVLAGPPATGSAQAAGVRRALRLLGDEGRRGRAGPFDLLTDLGDESLLPYLDRLAASVVDLYHRRYGLPVPSAPSGPARPAEGPGTVVVFARGEDFEAFRSGTDAEVPIAADASAFTRGRIAVLHAGNRTRTQLSRLVVHELVHLLNRLTFGPSPPPWIDEGLAGDLELFPVDDEGRLLEIPLGPTSVRLADADRAYGPLVPLERLVLDARRGRLEPLVRLATLTPADLHASPRRAELYALSALWIRFLLDSGDPAHATTLRHRLHTLAQHPDPLPHLLPPHPEALEPPFHRWLTTLYRRLSPPVR